MTRESKIDTFLDDIDIAELATFFDLLAQFDAEDKKFAAESGSAPRVGGESAPGASQDTDGLGGELTYQPSKAN